MSKKITVLCSIIVVLAICVTVFGVSGTPKTDVTTATADVFYAENEEAARGIIDDVVEGFTGTGTSSSLGDALGDLGGGALGDSLGNIGSGSSGGIGDALAGIGDALGGVGDGLGDMLGGITGGIPTQKPTTAPTQTTSADIGLIIPVPAATQTTQTTEGSTASNEVVGETVDYAATSNPYKKPTGTYSAGDKDDGIKWIQWIFIYSGYGLKDNGITGVLDEDTVAVVKKLQHENGLTVDGNITEDIIKAAEVLYYQSVLGNDVSAVEVPSQTTAGVSVSYESVENEKGSDVPVALLVVVLVIIWLLAIGGIVLLFVFKKKKNAAQKLIEKEEFEKIQVSKNAQGEISGIADLFEEVEKKSK